MSGDSLPLDVTEAILLRLPVKSVGRFKCVSKTWNSLIHNPHFIKKHLHQTTSTRSPKASNLILLSDTCSFYLIDVTQLLPYLNNDDIIDIPATAKEIFTPPPPVDWAYHYGSRNGLVLVEDGEDAVFLWNPTTKEIWEIPANPIPLPFKKSLVLYGFGYVPQDDDYKIVSMSFWEVNSTDMHDFNRQFLDMFVSVYSLRNNSWRKLSNIHFKGVRHIANNHVLINQNLHLLYSPRSSSVTLLAFSLTNEEFNEIKLPVENDRAGIFLDLADLGGKLGVFSYLAGARYCLYVMEEYGVCESWTKLCVFGDDQMPNPRCLAEGSYQDIVLSDKDGFFVYNIDEKRRRNIKVGSNGFFVIGTYVESLESPKRIFTTPP